MRDAFISDVSPVWRRHRLGVRVHLLQHRARRVRPVARLCDARATTRLKSHGAAGTARCKMCRRPPMSFVERSRAQAPQGDAAPEGDYRDSSSHEGATAPRDGSARLLRWREHLLLGLMGDERADAGVARSCEYATSSIHGLLARRGRARSRACSDIAAASRHHKPTATASRLRSATPVDSVG